MLRTFTTLACLVPALALGQNVGAPLRGTSLVVNEGPGDQTEPHVSGSLVAYTNQSSLGSSEIRYHDLSSGLDQAIPNEGGYDAISDISGEVVVFTRATNSSRVFRFDVSKGGVAEELAPRSGADRRAATVGGQTVVWQELGYTAESVLPEIFAYRMDAPTLTRLSEDTSVDRAPAVSADGQAVVWMKCATTINGCDIWAAQAVEGGYLVSQLTGVEGEESLPDTNGEVVVYETRSTVDGVSEADIAWQPVGGGEVRRLALPGTDTNPNISGPIIAFERWMVSEGTPNFDLVLYDLRTQTYYRLTETPDSESLSDISVDANGMARVVWTARQDGHLNVYAYMFRLPSDCELSPTDQDPAAVCASPGVRPLLGTLLVNNSSGASKVLSTEVEDTGMGVLCVDNGFEGTRASEGRVWLGKGLLVGPSELGQGVASMARAVPLQGRRMLSARLDDAPGSAFRVRLYGTLSCEASEKDVPFEGTEILHGELVPSESLGRSFDTGGFTHYFVSSGYEGKLASDPGLTEDDEASSRSLPGCSTGGGSASLLGVWMLASVLLRGRAARA